MSSFVPSLLLAGALFSIPPAVRAEDGVDQLDQSALQEAFRILKRNYIREQALSYEELNRSALSGLLDRLGKGATLVSSAPSTEPADTPVEFHADLIMPRLGYIRFADYSEGELEEFHTALGGFKEAKAHTLILDLRVAQTAPDLLTTARILDSFVPADAILFKIQRHRDQRPTLFISRLPELRWKGSLILLIDEETCSAGEIIAASIQRYRKVLTIGQPTPGETVEYDEVPLNGDIRLRFAVAEILLGDDSSLFQKGVEPEFVIQQDPTQKHKVFAASSHAPLSRYIFEHARPRLNEAALVHDTDPELDYHLARARGEQTRYDRLPLLDLTLQRAVDLVRSMEFLHGDGLYSAL